MAAALKRVLRDARPARDTTVPTASTLEFLSTGFPT